MESHSLALILVGDQISEQIKLCKKRVENDVGMRATQHAHAHAHAHAWKWFSAANTAKQ